MCKKIDNIYEENTNLIYNKNRKYKIVGFRGENEIRIVDVSYGDNNNMGYWVSASSFFDTFKARTLIAHLESKHLNLKQIP